VKILKNKTEALRDFAKTIPNVESMAVDYGRDKLTVFFDGIHSQEYIASQIISKIETAYRQRGVTIIWE